MPGPGSDPEFRTLLAKLLDEEIQPEEMERLAAVLRNNPEAQAFYKDYLLVHCLLTWQTSLRSDVPNPTGIAVIDGLALEGRVAEGPIHEGPALAVPLPDVPVPQSPVLGFLGDGFLGDVGRQGWGLFSDHTLLFSVLAALVIAGAVALWSLNCGRQKPDNGSEIADHQSEISNSKSQIAATSPLAPLSAPRSPSPARLVRAKDCRWNGQSSAPQVGQMLPIGQPLSLASGVAEIDFDIGAKVILQSPASLEIQSADSARLGMGKLTAEITSPAARGFKIRTPQATYVDQGTEFGVEVSPGGDSRIHVFKGRVDVALGGEGPAGPQRVMANAGARLEADSPSLMLVADTGESFIRSMDESGRDRHVIAYWRFEDWPVGTLLPHSARNTRAVRATTDSSFNGNDLFTWNSDTQPNISGAVPAAVVPQTAAANRGCLDNSLPHVSGVMTRDLYTQSQFSHSWPLDIQRVTPEKWTIEVAVKPARLGCGCQTFVVRDGNVHLRRRAEKIAALAPPRLVFQIAADDRFAIRFRDVDDRLHEAVAAEPPLREGQWYYLAATSDSHALRLYVDARDGRGYQLRAVTPLPPTGSTALGKGPDECMWAIGRGKVKGFPAEWFQGFIDEVRVSDLALEPAQFLFAPKDQGKEKTIAKTAAEEHKR